MKGKMQGVSQYTSEAIQQQTIRQLSKVDKALCSAAYKMRDKGKRLFINNGYNYDISTLADGIMLGKLIKRADETEITLHAFGTVGRKGTNAYQLFKTRFFAGGTISRKTASGKNRGFIKDLATIEKSLDQTILDNEINKALYNE